MSINKRQKTPKVCGQPEDIQKSLHEKKFQRRKYTLDILPSEVLEMILRLLPFHDVAYSVRLVSRRCSIVGATVLNGAFLGFGTKLENLMKQIKTMMLNIKTDTELLACSKAFHALETIQVQYKMIRAVTWRYTHPPGETKFPRFCFYAGILLDELDDLIRRATKCPGSFISSHAMDPRVSCFVALCKRFMNFFEKVSERRVNRSALVSGCKVVDILDCLIEGRQVLLFKVPPRKEGRYGTVNMKLKYVIKRAWFTCLEVPKTVDENSWRDEQRFMYLRLRRLVGSVNEHLLESLHYEHELLVQVPSTISLRSPPASTYSGYGEYGGRFFYYGNMNKYAFDNKFKLSGSAELVNAGFETEEEVISTPSFDLVIEVELKCTPELAPLAVRRTLKTDEFEISNTNACKRQELSLKLNMICPASAANRLPDNFTWEIHTRSK